MKIREIQKIPQQSGHGISDMSVFDNVAQYKNVFVESFPLLFNEDSDYYYFCYEVENRKVAFLIGEKNTYNNKDCIIVRRSWVDPLFRNRGYMKALYNTLHNNGFILVSDNELSPESISIWKELNNRHGVNVYNKADGNTRPAVEKDFIDDNNNEIFIFESKNINFSRFEKPFLNNDNDFLLEYEYYIENKYKEIRK